MTPKPDDEVKRIGAYYDEWTDQYLKVFGDTFQACRPSKLDDLHLYVMERAGINDGEKILDAGCGICGPSSYFAAHKNIQIDAVTISSYQVEIARQILKEKGLQERVAVHCGDYNELDKLFPEESFDRIVFLESLSHAADLQRPLTAAFKVLKPGGVIYIKDFFQRIGNTEAEIKWIQTIIERTDEAFATHTPRLNETVEVLTNLGFLSEMVEPVRFEIDNSVWIAFNHVHHFDLYRGGTPVQWLNWVELRFRKPEDRRVKHS